MTTAIIRLPYQPYPVTASSQTCYTCMEDVTPPAVGHAGDNNNVIHPQHLECAEQSLNAGYHLCGLCRKPLDPTPLGYLLSDVIAAGQQRAQAIETEIVFERFVAPGVGSVRIIPISNNPRVVDYGSPVEFMKTFVIHVAAWLIFCGQSKTPFDQLVSTSVAQGALSGIGKLSMERCLTISSLYLLTSPIVACYATHDWITNINMTVLFSAVAFGIITNRNQNMRISIASLLVISNLAGMCFEYMYSTNKLTGPAIISFVVSMCTTKLLVG